MTIGDEKVVAEVGTVFDLRWIGSGPLAYLVNRHGVKVGDKLVPLKAYAELAAERDALQVRYDNADSQRLNVWNENEDLRKKIADTEGAMDAWFRAATAAEFQLAELRGRLEGLARARALVDHVIHREEGVESLHEVHDFLSTLAAADGGVCDECNGTGLISFKTFPGGIEVDNDDQPCPECGDKK